MYSRNYTSDGVSSGIRLTPNVRVENSKKQQENVPVKSFTDNFAYDRFNRMGNVKPNYSETQEPQSADESTEAISLPVEAPPSIPSAENEDKDVNAGGKNGILDKLKSIFDADTIIIILAVAMLLFSENATNDKLTPLALLAILFF